MDDRTKRTILRLLSVFLAAGAGDAIIQFAASTTYDWHHLAAAMVAAGIVAAETYLKDSTSLASPTVGAVNDALKPPGSAIVAGFVPPTVTSAGAATPTVTNVIAAPRLVVPPSESRSPRRL